MYPETKHPTYFQSIGLPLEPALVAIRAATAWTGATRPCSCSPSRSNLVELPETTGCGRPAVFLRRQGLRRHPAQADHPRRAARAVAPGSGLGPDKDLIIPRRADGSLGEPTTLVADAHAAGLVVHP